MVVKRVVRRRVQVKKRKVEEEPVPIEDESSAESEDPTPPAVSGGRLWIDDEDNGEIAPQQVTKPEWAAVADRTENDKENESDADSDISEEDVYQKRTDHVIDRSKSIPHGTIAYQSLRDANRSEYSEASVNAVDFNLRNPTVMLTASPDHRLRLFQVDNNGSSKLQTVKFDDFPLRNAKFSPAGNLILCGASRPRYALVDVEKSAITMVNGFNASERNHNVFTFSPYANQVCFSSHTGSSHVVSLATHQVIYSLKGDGPCSASAFHPTNDNQLFTIGGSKVYVWDIRTRRPLKIHQDAGSLLSTSLGVSDNHYAVGSSSGVVNVYNMPKVWSGGPLDEPPAPQKSIMSLTTEVSFSSFNSTGDVLCIGSQKKKNAFRLVHVPSQTVFSNFPRPGRQYRKPVCCGFSPSSGLLCLGMYCLFTKLHMYKSLKKTSKNR